LSSIKKSSAQQLVSLVNSLSPDCDEWRKFSHTSRTTTAETNKLPWWKRLLDITCILVSLPCWLIVFIAIAIWIKLVSPGPIFFCQQRLGRGGRTFKIFKFRTMEVNVETKSHELHLQHLISADCPMTKLDASGDPRIIFGGRILRALGLDELPQLFNVLRKEMSLVGPRPCTPNEFEMYKSWQLERFNAVPGLTGYWQVNGKNKTTFRQMIEMDIYYARHASFWLDILILLRTIPAIVGQAIESRISMGRQQKVKITAPLQSEPRSFGEPVQR
jgi:lipopolysaccharide/colanic/teichoic acid biosynthesis glycosyltransferase